MINFPKHKCGLYLIHNEHKDYYQDIKSFIEESDDRLDWESEEAKQRAIDTDEIWVLQWYPNTPIGFIAIAAPTLEELINFASEDE